MRPYDIIVETHKVDFFLNTRKHRKINILFLDPNVIETGPPNKRRNSHIKKL